MHEQTGVMDEDEGEDEDEDEDYGGSYGSYFEQEPQGPRWICRNCTSEDNDADSQFCHNCSEPRGRDAVAVAQVGRDGVEAWHRLPTAIGYDERMCLHKQNRRNSSAQSDEEGNSGRAMSEEGLDSEQQQQQGVVAVSVEAEQDDTDGGELQADGGAQEAATEPPAQDAPPSLLPADGEEAVEAVEAQAEATAPAADTDAVAAVAGAEGPASQQQLEHHSDLAVEAPTTTNTAGEVAAAASLQQEPREATTSSESAGVDGSSELQQSTGHNDQPAPSVADGGEGELYSYDGMPCNNLRRYINSQGVEFTKEDDEYHEITHPERPDRLKCVHEHFVAAGLLQGALAIPGREATGEEISVAHEAEHCSRVAEIDSDCTIDGDTYANVHTPTAARLAVGTTIDVVQAVVDGRAANGIALVRPPGHHAEPDKSMGFCLFNNAAIAARVAQQQMGVGRVLLLDWDVHHCNGTENIFYDDPSVLVVSIHRGDIFPGTGPASRTGDVGDAAGMNVNVAWPHGGMGDADYMLAMNRVVLPVWPRPPLRTCAARPQAIV
jgi:hypothetical protein